MVKVEPKQMTVIEIKSGRAKELSKIEFFSLITTEVMEVLQTF